MTDGEECICSAISQNRGCFWFPATYGVLPDHQGMGMGMGIGGQPMDAVLAHADGRQGMFSSTVHSGATRRYRLAGFSSYPQTRMVDTVDRSTLPVVAGFREWQASDLDWTDRLGHDLRGAGHGPDHGYMLDTLRLVASQAASELNQIM